MVNHHYRDSYRHAVEVKMRETALPLSSQTSTQVCCLSSSDSEAGFESYVDNNETSLDLTVQYGRGLCPTSFIPQSLLDECIPSQPQTDADAEADERTIILSLPTGSTTSTERTLHRIRLRYFRFLPSLAGEMERADIIICHAGAGTLLEALSISTQSEQKLSSKRKIINAVINARLMHNHQTELADELEVRGQISVTRDCMSEWTTQEGAAAFWDMIGACKPVPSFSGRRMVDGGNGRGENLASGHVSSFQQILDQVMGIDEKHSKRNASTKKTQ
jgi:beta-1,4-N-acetylglucosaminyltransferase